MTRCTLRTITLFAISSSIVTVQAWAATSIPAGRASTEALLKRQSQEFSDASASGDKNVLDRYLDDAVIFMNEGGELASKKDIVDSAVPSTKGVSNDLVQTDWHFAQHGDVAVTSFTDVSTVHVFGQLLTANYRSTEVWHLSHGRWTMISSQTMAVPDDPPAVTLGRDVLSDYVGTYQVDPTYVVHISLADGQLMSATNGGAATPIVAELKDVLFTRGQPRLRRIFERSDSGQITGFRSRREGHDIVFVKVAT